MEVSFSELERLVWEGSGPEARGEVWCSMAECSVLSVCAGSSGRVVLVVVAMMMMMMMMEECQGRLVHSKSLCVEDTEVNKSE